MYQYKPKNTPRWYEFRKKAAQLLVRFATKICPKSEDVTAFHMTQMMDMMITGGTITRIDPYSVYYKPLSESME